MTYFVSIPKNASESLHLIYGGNEYKHYHPMNIHELTGDYFDNPSFCVFRNPFERLVSWYEYHKLNMIPLYNMPFKDWVNSGCPHHWDNHPFLKYGTSPLHQHEYIFYKGKQIVDRVIKLEHLKRFVLTNKGVFLEHKNKSGIYKSYEYYYDVQTVDKVSELFHTDIKIYNAL